MFKKHPLQNRTNVQIKGGGGQRPFEQCSKKLHFFESKASLSKSLKMTFPKCMSVCNARIFSMYFDLIYSIESLHTRSAPLRSFKSRDAIKLLKSLYVRQRSRYTN